MNTKKSIFFAILTGLVLLACAQIQAAVLPLSSAPFVLEPSFALAPSTNVYAVKPYVLQLTLTSTQAVHISSVSVEANADFLIQSVQQQQDNAFLYTRIEIKFMALQAGVVSMPSIYFLAQSLGQEIFLKCAVPPLFVLPAEKPLDPRSLKDVKPPLGITFNYILVIVLTLVLLLIIGAIYFYRTAKKKKAQSQRVLDRPAHSVALEKIDQAWQLYQKNSDANTFYFKLSVIFREYLSREFKFDALEKTTTEIFSSMRALSIDRFVCLQCKDILANCDLVKFAQFVFSPQDTEKTFLTVRQFISARAPQESLSSDKPAAPRSSL